jgi:hypothetical protein
MGFVYRIVVRWVLAPDLMMEFWRYVWLHRHDSDDDMMAGVPWWDELSHGWDEL